MVGWKRIVVTVGEKTGKSHLTYAQGASVGQCVGRTASQRMAGPAYRNLPKIPSCSWFGPAVE